MDIDFWNRAWFERFAPIGAGVLVILACATFRLQISQQFSASGWQESNLYNAVFGWSSIQSGFVFAIYGFIVTKRDGFAGILIGGQSYERFLSFTRRACFGGFLLAVVSLPLVVASPKIDTAPATLFWSVSLWFSFFVWAFFAFMRVAFTFGRIIGTTDKPTRIPG